MTDPGSTTRAETRESPLVLELCRNPRHAGSLNREDPRVGTGESGSPGAGDFIRIQIRVGKSRVIETARFKAFGCGSSIAGAGLAAARAEGRTPDEAFAIGGAEIARDLALPASKIHCSVLAEEALRGALEDFLQKEAAGSSRGV